MRPSLLACCSNLKFNKWLCASLSSLRSPPEMRLHVELGCFSLDRKYCAIIKFWQADATDIFSYLRDCDDDLLTGRGGGWPIEWLCKGFNRQLPWRQTRWRNSVCIVPTAAFINASLKTSRKMRNAEHTWNCELFSPPETMYPHPCAVTSARSPALNELIMECTNYFILLFFTTLSRNPFS